MIKKHASLFFTIAAFVVTGLLPIHADPAPASGELCNLEGDIKVETFKTKDCVLSLSDENGKKVLKAEFPINDKYPRFYFPVQGEHWDLSAFGEVQVDVTNSGTETTKVFLQVSNPGTPEQGHNIGGKIELAPGETKTLQVNLSEKSKKGYALDPKQVSSIHIFVMKPTSPVKLSIGNLKATGAPKS